MKNIFSIRDCEIQEQLLTEQRQYLCGNLKNPQPLPFFQTASLEVGITFYENKRCDDPHYHLTTDDAIFVLEGTFYIMDISTEEVYTFHKGDFIIIPINTPYISKAEASAKVLFIKHPKSYDKALIDVSKNESVLKWMHE